MLKDIWFYIKDFFKKGPLYVLVFLLQIIVVSVLAYFFLEIMEVTSQLLGRTEPIYSEEHQLTQEELSNTYFVVPYLAIHIVGVFICIVILRFLRWVLKKVGIITKESLFIKPPEPKQPLW